MGGCLVIGEQQWLETKGRESEFPHEPGAKHSPHLYPTKRPCRGGGEHNTCGTTRSEGGVGCTVGQTKALQERGGVLLRPARESAPTWMKETLSLHAVKTHLAAPILHLCIRKVHPPTPTPTPSPTTHQPAPTQHNVGCCAKLLLLRKSSHPCALLLLSF